MTLITSLSVRLVVLATTPPQPAAKALQMTRALVPGGPLPNTKGLSKSRPLTRMARVVATVSLLWMSPVWFIPRTPAPLPGPQDGDEKLDRVFWAGVICSARGG